MVRPSGVFVSSGVPGALLWQSAGSNGGGPFLSPWGGGGGAGGLLVSDARHGTVTAIASRQAMGMMILMAVLQK
jgi:hypothetical protein